MNKFMITAKDGEKVVRQVILDRKDAVDTVNKLIQGMRAMDETMSWLRAENLFRKLEQSKGEATEIRGKHPSRRLIVQSYT